MLDESLLAWLSSAVRRDASDLHLVPGHPPVLRIHGGLAPLEHAPLTAESLTPILRGLCPPEIYDRFEIERDADFSFEAPVEGRTRRFRANYFLADRLPAACFRLVPADIPSFEWAGFPRPLAERLAYFRDGLVLLTGVTGSGKTTSLAMIVQLLNEAGGYRIITVEEPVEYVFPRRPNSIVTQREVGLDVRTFADGLKHGLRQDPDVILVGEIRDRSTAQMALSAAETGHLVFSTLHTRDAKGAVSRLVDLFPQDVQAEIRSQLALSLRAVISQHLLPSATPGGKRELALEVLFNNAAIASAVRFGKLESIDNCILTGRNEGMLTLDESIKRLLVAGVISREMAERFAKDPAYLRR